MRNPHRISLGILIAAVSLACSDGNAREAPRSGSAVNGDQCDRTLWQHVYEPSRLHIVTDCVTTSGVISEIGPDDDGDEHMLLHLDKGQESMVNKKNFKKKGGDLVVEVVCAHKPTLKKAKAACKGYGATIPLPQQGDHVTVTGTFVIDTHNGWTEIHPATSITRR